MDYFKNRSKMKLDFVNTDARINDQVTFCTRFGRLLFFRFSFFLRCFVFLGSLRGGNAGCGVALFRCLRRIVFIDFFQYSVTSRALLVSMVCLPNPYGIKENAEFNKPLS